VVLLAIAARQDGLFCGVVRDASPLRRDEPLAVRGHTCVTRHKTNSFVHNQVP
jgi:hypothetical protein